MATICSAALNTWANTSVNTEKGGGDEKKNFDPPPRLSSDRPEQVVYLNSELATQKLEGEDLFFTLIDIWLYSDEETPTKIKNAIQAHDWQTAKHVAHSIKGTASSLGMFPLAEIAKQLEQKSLDMSVSESDLLQLQAIYEETRQQAMRLHEIKQAIDRS